MFDQYMFCSYMCSHQNKRTKTNQSSLNLYVFFCISVIEKDKKMVIEKNKSRTNKTQP